MPEELLLIGRRQALKCLKS